MFGAAFFLAAVVLTPQTEIVLAANAPFATRLAADELNHFLGRVLGSPLAVVSERSSGRTAIVLGGGCVEKRDGFVIEATNGVVRIYGNDDDVPGGDISKTC